MNQNQIGLYLRVELLLKHTTDPCEINVNYPFFFPTIPQHHIHFVSSPVTWCLDPSKKACHSPSNKCALNRFSITSKQYPILVYSMLRKVLHSYSYGYYQNKLNDIVYTKPVGKNI